MIKHKEQTRQIDTKSENVSAQLKHNNLVGHLLISLSKYVRFPFGPYGIDFNQDGLKWLHRVVAIRWRCYIDKILQSEAKMYDVIFSHVNEYEKYVGLPFGPYGVDFYPDRLSWLH